MDTVDSATREVILKTLSRADEPLSVSRLSKQLTGPFRLSVDDLGRFLDEETRNGHLHRFEPYKGGGSRYWTRDAADYAKIVICASLRKTPRTRSELTKTLKAPLRGVSETLLRNARDDLITVGKIKEFPKPPGAKVTRLGLGKPDPSLYLKDAVNRIRKEFKKLEPFGVTTAECTQCLTEMLREAGLSDASASTVAAPTGVPAAVASTPLSPIEKPTAPAAEPAEQCTPTQHPETLDLDDLERRLIQAMRTLQPGADHGALVTARELRATPELTQLDKATFDRAVLRLAGRGKLALHGHDFPASLTEAERDVLITDGKGQYYVGIAIRR